MNSLTRPAHRLPTFRVWLALVGLLFAQGVWATVPLYINDNNVTYSIPGSPPPQIDATAFDNDAGGVFTIDFSTFNPGTPFFEPVNTLFYTNTGTMIMNSPTLTNGISLLTLGTSDFAVGYRFDTQSGSQHSWADTFYNPGTIRCASAIDGNNFFGIATLFGNQLFALNSFGQCVVGATNVMNQGTVDVSEEGLISFTGRNVDLSQGNFIIEPPLFLSGLFGTVAFSGFGTVGAQTNNLFLWNPGADLGATFAESSYSPVPNIIILNNSTAYIDDEPDPNNQGTIIHRAVFIEDQSDTNIVTHNVYFDPLTTTSPIFQNATTLGTLNVGWTATYIDPASGAPTFNYLYLNDDAVFGATTNVLVLGSVPDNFALFNSTTPLFNNPAPAGFVNEFPNVNITNRYAFMSGFITAATSSTNVSSANPHGTITNLPGQLFITASNELNLAFTTVSGPNYLNLNCTNQFDGSPGAAIAAPYSDIALGVTNGSLAISNVLMAHIPDWSGPLQAWSTRFFTTTTNALGNVITNDFRIMIVFSDLQPTTAPWIQNCYLHATNSLVLSDALNIYSSFYSDAAELTLNTNQVGVGATSLYGQLFWNNTATFNANSGNGLQQMPNLLWLTNNGAFIADNNANFGNSASQEFVVTPGVPQPSTNYAAFVNHSSVADLGTTIWTGYFENDGTISDGTGSFVLHSGQAVLTNGNVSAAGDVILVATNVPQMGNNGLVVSNLMIQAGHQLTLVTTNLSDTDNGITNSGIWTVGTTSGGGTADSGFNIPVKPVVGDLLGTTVTNIAPFHKSIYNIWSGNDYGISTQGYTNNLAVGHYVLDSLTTNGVLPVAYVFNGSGISNAMYVDLLELQDGATQGSNSFNYNFPWLHIGTNMFIYYARAIKTISGQAFDVSEAIDTQSKLGANGGRLRWISSYAGIFSSTNLVYTNSSGMVFSNTINIALAQSTDLDSDGDGLVNSLDPTPFFVPQQLNFGVMVTNSPANSVRIQWVTIPNATNFVYYTTNLLSTNWLPFNSFKNWYYGNNVAKTNALQANSFHSPQVYPYPGGNPSAPDNGTQTNVWLYDAITNVPHYYKVVVWPWLDFKP